MMILTLLAAMALSDLAACAPPANAEALWRSDARFVIVGETHGTAQAPAAYAELVCQALEHGPVTAAIEFPTAMQSTLDAFMAAENDSSARAVLMAYPYGPFRFHDGRGSEAMMDMLLRLRALHREGRPLSLVASLPETERVEGFSQAYGELERGVLWARMAQARPDNRMLILVGRMHAEKTRRTGSPVDLPAAGHLRASDVISLSVAQQGGEAWTCVEDCEATALDAVDSTGLRGVVLTSQDDGRFNGLLALGPWTASSPAGAVAP